MKPKNKAGKKEWQCKKHGKDCRSYVAGLVKELNETQREPTEDDLKLVERSTGKDETLDSLWKELKKKGIGFIGKRLDNPITNQIMEMTYEQGRKDALKQVLKTIDKMPTTMSLKELKSRIKEMIK